MIGSLNRPRLPRTGDPVRKDNGAGPGEEIGNKRQCSLLEKMALRGMLPKDVTEFKSSLPRITNCNGMLLRIQWADVEHGNVGGRKYTGLLGMLSLSDVERADSEDDADGGLDDVLVRLCVKV